MKAIQIVVNKEERWHLNLLTRISHQLENLTLTIRSRQQDATPNEVLHDGHIIFGGMDEDLLTLSHLIFKMPVLKRLQIYFEIAGQFEVKSTSLEYLKFRGSKWGASLALNECMFPHLKTMDISIDLDQIDNDTIIKLLPPFVEDLTLHVASRPMSASIKCARSMDSDDTTHAGSEFEDDKFQDLGLLIGTMPQLRTLNILPSAGTSFIVNPRVHWEGINYVNED